jgi:hypothetical protein
VNSGISANYAGTAASGGRAEPRSVISPFGKDGRVALDGGVEGSGSRVIRGESVVRPKWNSRPFGGTCLGGGVVILRNPVQLTVAA